MNKIDTEKIRELCSVCGGSKKVWPTDEFGLREEGVGKIPCPICQAPAAKVEEFLALLQKERNCWSEHNSTGQIIEKACTHLTAQAKQIKDLKSGHFCPNPQLSKLATNCDCAHSDKHRAIDWATIERLQAKIKDLEEGAFAANEEAQIKKDQIKQLEKEDRKLKNQKEYIYKPEIDRLEAENKQWKERYIEAVNDMKKLKKELRVQEKPDGKE